MSTHSFAKAVITFLYFREILRAYSEPSLNSILAVLQNAAGLQCVGITIQQHYQVFSTSHGASDASLTVLIDQEHFRKLDPR